MGKYDTSDLYRRQHADEAGHAVLGSRPVHLEKWRLGPAGCSPCPPGIWDRSRSGVGADVGWAMGL